MHKIINFFEFVALRAHKSPHDRDKNTKSLNKSTQYTLNLLRLPLLWLFLCRQLANSSADPELTEVDNMITALSPKKKTETALFFIAVIWVPCLFWADFSAVHVQLACHNGVLESDGKVRERNEIYISLTWKLVFSVGNFNFKKYVAFSCLHFNCYACARARYIIFGFFCRYSWQKFTLSCTFRTYRRRRQSCKGLG